MNLEDLDALIDEEISEASARGKEFIKLIKERTLKAHLSKKFIKEAIEEFFEGSIKTLH